MSTLAPAKAGQASRVIDWNFAHFDDLTVRELHDILAVRAAVFVVEQKCAFQDVDGADPACWHLLGRENGAVVAYCRLARFRTVESTTNVNGCWTSCLTRLPSFIAGA